MCHISYWSKAEDDDGIDEFEVAYLDLTEVAGIVTRFNVRARLMDPMVNQK